MAKRVVAVENLLFQPLGDEAVILNLNDEKYYTLNGLGLRMWQLLTGGMAVDDTVQALLAEYEVEEAVLRADIEKFVQHLQERSLIEVHDV
jgi:hypothetical protein